MTPTKRPRWLIALFVGLMFMQAGALLRWGGLPSESASSLSLNPALEFVLSGFWLLIFAWTVSRLWRKPSTWHRSLILLWLFGAYSVGRLVIFARADYDRGRLPFLLIAFGVFTLILGAIYGWRWLWLRRNTP